MPEGGHVPVLIPGRHQPDTITPPTRRDGIGSGIIGQ